MAKKIIIIISLFVALIGGWLFLWPQYQDLQSLHQEIKNKQDELQKTNDFFANLAKAKTELQNYSSEDLAKLDAALPKDPSNYLPALFNYLQTTAGQTGLAFKEISGVTISQSKERPSLREVVFNVQLVGSYASLKNWLSQINKSARIIEVENISFAFEKSSAEKTKGAPESFTFKIKLKTFSY